MFTSYAQCRPWPDRTKTALASTLGPRSAAYHAGIHHVSYLQHLQHLPASFPNYSTMVDPRTSSPTPVDNITLESIYQSMYQSVHQSMHQSTQHLMISSHAPTCIEIRRHNNKIIQQWPIQLLLQIAHPTTAYPTTANPTSLCWPQLQRNDIGLGSYELPSSA